jgi:hypothetical protein
VKEFDLVKSKIEAQTMHCTLIVVSIGPNKGLFIRADFEKKQTICIWLLFWEG